MKKKPLAERIAARTTVAGETECWVFRSYETRSGHRRMWVNGRMALVHRVAWELVNGPIPPGLCVCHTCDNPPCVNPRHLWLGTVGDNNADRDRKGRGVMPPYHLVPRQTPGPIKHGTIYAYSKRKCRCDDCRARMREYRRERGWVK